MCGICGIAGELNNKKFYENTMPKMLESLYHRGPDDEGVFKDKDIIFGARRLSIIDLVNGHQPMSNEDQTLWIVFNGEIYNFLELRELLQKKGHIFKSRTDTEVILHLYEEEGPDCVRRLNGMFAFSIWDKKNTRVILARDRFGIKPLYYTFINNILVFASELKAILTFPEIRKEIDPAALDSYLSLEYVPSPKSILKNIYKLLPAHILIYKNGDMDIKRYWSLESKDHTGPRDESDVKQALFSLLKKSVKGCSISDVPIGVYLSGGIDSSSIIAISREVFAQTLKTFSIGFEEDSFDESRYSKQVSSLFNTEHKHRVFDSDDAISILPEISRMLDEPLADGSIFPTYILSRFSRQDITVALSGDGGDEVFAGYPTYQAHAFIKYYRRLPLFIRKKIIERLINKMPVDYRNFSLDFVAKRFISGADIDEPLPRHMIWMSAFTEADKSCLYNGWLKGQLEDKLNFLTFFGLNRETDDITLFQKLDMESYLKDDLLVKIDRSSMMNSQEVRVPYLDHELVEFVFNLPSHLRLNRFRTKYLLKETMKDYLPKGIIKRRKKGFGMPIAFWIKNQLKEYILDMLNEDRVKREGLFDYKYIKKILNEHLENKVDNRKKIWALFMFELWHNNYIG